MLGETYLFAAIHHRSRNHILKELALLTPQSPRKKSAAVVSLHFAYAHASHLFAYANAFMKLGFDVTLVLDEKYRSFISDSTLDGVQFIFTENGSSVISPFDVALLYNSSPKNHRLARNLRSKGTTVLYVFHEPEPMWSMNVLRSEGLKKTIRFVGSSAFSALTARASSRVIVCSEFGCRLYNSGYSWINRNVRIVPLVFNDEIGEARFQQMRSEKHSFGFVGTACKSHGFIEFIQFAKHALQNESRIPFLIATRTDITSTLLADPEFAAFVETGRIRLIHGRELSNEEINACYLRCVCIWNVYRRSTQSGVLPRAYMAGTAVLAGRLGSFPEYVIPGVTGELVELTAGPEETLRVVNEIFKNQNVYIQGCRSSFLKTFWSEANVETLDKLLRETSSTPVLAQTPELVA